MNRFVKIIELKDFSGQELTYYTLKLEDRNENEFTDFISRHIHNQKIIQQLNYLNETLENFSHNGAREYFFRPERSFHALPPPARFIDIDIEGDPLRLYCLRISNRMVFLFNGGIKTKDKAQDCPNVGKYFLDAERLTKLIDEGIRSGDLILDDEKQNIINLKDAELWLT